MATSISLSDDEDLVLDQDNKYRPKDTDSEDRPSEDLIFSEAEYEDSSKDKDIDTTSTDINTLNTFDIKFDESQFKDEELYCYIEPCIEHGMHDNCAMNIEWDERLNLQENKERKKKIKEKLLMANKGKFIVDYKKIWNQDNTYNYIPTDILCILKDEDVLDKVKDKVESSWF